MGDSHEEKKFLFVGPKRHLFSNLLASVSCHHQHTKYMVKCVSPAVDGKSTLRTLLGVSESDLICLFHGAFCLGK